MPGGAFNTSKFIQELGLKPVGPDEMRVLSDIQPVLIAGDLSGTTPPHIAPSAFFGLLLAGAVGLHGTVELQVLSPGGCFIEWISLDSPVVAVQMRVGTVTLGTATPVVAAGFTSRDPVASLVTTDAVAIGGASVTLSQTGIYFPFNPNPMFVPSGSFFSLQTQTANSFGTVGFAIREVPAAENL